MPNIAQGGVVNVDLKFDSSAATVPKSDDGFQNYFGNLAKAKIIVFPTGNQANPIANFWALAVGGGTQTFNIVDNAIYEFKQGGGAPRQQIQLAANQALGDYGVKATLHTNDANSTATTYSKTIDPAFAVIASDSRNVSIVTNTVDVAAVAFSTFKHTIKVTNNDAAKKTVKLVIISRIKDSTGALLSTQSLVGWTIAAGNSLSVDFPYTVAVNWKWEDNYTIEAQVDEQGAGKLAGPDVKANLLRNVTIFADDFTNLNNWQIPKVPDVQTFQAANNEVSAKTQNNVGFMTVKNFNRQASYGVNCEVYSDTGKYGAGVIVAVHNGNNDYVILEYQEAGGNSEIDQIVVKNAGHVQVNGCNPGVGHLNNWFNYNLQVNPDGDGKNITQSVNYAGDACNNQGTGGSPSEPTSDVGGIGLYIDPTTLQQVTVKYRKFVVYE